MNLLVEINFRLCTPKPFNEGWLPEEDGHKIYFAEYGNPDGEVIVNLHGGPGSKSKAEYAKRFNIKKYRLVTFDQRGCGKSEPRGSIEQNTTQKLVSDMERLRQQLGLETWFVAGSSWGSTLALVYAETHPDRVKGLMLSAIFQADSVALDWFNKTPDGAAMEFTDIWDKRVESLKEFGVSDGNGVKELHNKIINGTEAEQRRVAAIFANWESNLLSALREVKFTYPEEVEENDINDAKIFLHYEVNQFFLDHEQIMKNAEAIKNIPTMIFHGRHDMICPFEQAWKLHQVLTKSELVVAPQSNHQFSPDGEVARYWAFEAFLRGLV